MRGKDANEMSKIPPKYFKLHKNTCNNNGAFDMDGTVQPSSDESEDYYEEDYYESQDSEDSDHDGLQRNGAGVEQRNDAGVEQGNGAGVQQRNDSTNNSNLSSYSASNSRSSTSTRVSTRSSISDSNRPSNYTSNLGGPSNSTRSSKRLSCSASSSNRPSYYTSYTNRQSNSVNCSNGQPNIKQIDTSSNKKDQKHSPIRKKRRLEKSNNSNDAGKACSKYRSRGRSNITNSQNDNTSMPINNTNINNLNNKYKKENSSNQNLAKKGQSRINKANRRQISAHSSIPPVHEAKVKVTNSDQESQGKSSEIIPQLDRFPVIARIFAKFHEDQVVDTGYENPGKMERKRQFARQELNKLNKYGAPGVGLVKGVRERWEIIEKLMGSFSDDSLNLHGQSTSSNKKRQKMNREYRHGLSVDDYLPTTHYLEEPDPQVYKNINYFIHGAHRGGIKFYRDQSQSP